MSKLALLAARMIQHVHDTQARLCERCQHPMTQHRHMWPPNLTCLVRGCGCKKGGN